MVTDKIVDTTVDLRVSSVGYVVILWTMESGRITYLLRHNQRMNDQQRANMMLEIQIVRTNRSLCIYCMQNMRSAIA